LNGASIVPGQNRRSGRLLAPAGRHGTTIANSRVGDRRRGAPA
jgi:hypothetical protein